MPEPTYTWRGPTLPSGLSGMSKKLQDYYQEAMQRVLSGQRLYPGDFLDGLTSPNKDLELIIRYMFAPKFFNREASPLTSGAQAISKSHRTDSVSEANKLLKKSMGG